jgi:hypothetical protein
MTRLIAFTGLAGSGKTTAARYLVEQHDFVRVRFADPLKAMLRTLGLSEAEIDSELKEAPSPLLGGWTPRHAMQTLGTEWGRLCMGEDFWVNHWQMRTANWLRLGRSVVVDDCRFENEAAAVRVPGGKIVRIVGRGGIGGEHISEQMAFAADVVIGNETSRETFWRRIADLVV